MLAILVHLGLLGGAVATSVWASGDADNPTRPHEQAS
jgi:hypothetical protein